MATKANKKSSTSKKKATAKKTKAKASKLAKKGASKKHAAHKKTTQKKAAKKKTAKKKAKSTKASNPGKKATAKAGKRKSTSNKSSAEEETTIAIEDLEEIDDLVQDAPAVKKTTKRGPQTPSVPRAVKPPPKNAKIEMDAEVLAFVEAVDAYRQEHCRPFPTWTEIFFLLKQLGYSKN